MVFGPKYVRDRSLQHIEIKVNNEIINKSDICKILGLYTDYKLRFDTHVNHIIKRSFSNLRLIYANREILNTKVKIILCEGLVLSHLTYCDVVYGPCLTKLNCQRLQRVQNYCVRLICNLRKCHPVTQKLLDMNWLSMNKRRFLHCATLFNKLLLLKKPVYLHRKLTFRSDIHNVNIRRKDLLTMPRHHTTGFQKSFSYMICKVLNIMPPDLINNKNSLFKRKLKKMLLENYFVIDFNI